MTDEAKQRVAREMGPEFADVDWAGLDPRRYHPKRLIADAWNAPADASDAQRPVAGAAAAVQHDPDADLLELAERRAEATEPSRPVVHLELGS